MKNKVSTLSFKHIVHKLLCEKLQLHNKLLHKAIWSITIAFCNPFTATLRTDDCTDWHASLQQNCMWRIFLVLAFQSVWIHTVNTCQCKNKQTKNSNLKIVHKQRKRHKVSKTKSQTVFEILFLGFIGILKSFEHVLLILYFHEKKKVNHYPLGKIAIIYYAQCANLKSEVSVIRDSFPAYHTASLNPWIHE